MGASQTLTASTLEKDSAAALTGLEVFRLVQNGAPVKLTVDTLTNYIIGEIDSDLSAIAALTPADGSFIVGNGTAWITESGNTARTSLGLGTGDSPTFDGLTLTHATDDVTSAITTATGRFASYKLTSGAGIAWTIGTQDDYVSNRLVFRGNSTDRMYLGTDGIYLPLTGQKIDFLAGQHTITEDDSLKQLNFRTSSQIGQFNFYRESTIDQNEALVDIAMRYDAIGANAASGGHMLKLNFLIGDNSMCAGSPVALAVNTLVQRMQHPAVEVSEPGGIIMLVQANRSATDAYQCNYWGTDWSVNGPVGIEATREHYMGGLNLTMSKYAPGITIDSEHMGSIVAHFSTTPFGGADAPNRSNSDSYQMKWGVAITGYSGNSSTTTGGHHASATTAFERALQIGGRAGAWMHTRDSKYDTGLYILDHLVYGIHLTTRHPDNTGQAMYIEQGAGSVGIWGAPSSSTRPLTMGTSSNGEMYCQITNTNAGASALAGYEMITDVGTAQLFTASAAAGAHTTLTTPGDLYVVASASGKFVQFATNNTGRVRITDSGTVVGQTTLAATFGAGTVTPYLQVHTTGMPLGMGRYSADATGPVMYLGKSRHATVGSHTIVQSGDVLGQIHFAGSDGTNFSAGASIKVEVDDTPGAANDMPGRLIVSTTPNGSGTLTERLRIDNGGHIIALSATATPPTLATNGQWVMTPTSNTNMRISYRGSDGTTRVGDITLA
jgi:hypothetical protein